MIATTLTVSDAKLILEALREQLELHVALNLDCISPPIVTTHYLNVKGLPAATIRRLWHRLENGYRLTIYERGELTVDIVLEHERGSAYHEPSKGIPVDHVTCRRLEGCVLVTNTNKLYGFLLVRAEENLLKISILKTLCLLERAKQGIGVQLLNLVSGALTGEAGSIERLIALLASLLSEFRNVMRAVSPLLPVNVEEALLGSRILRLVYGVRR